ncbi:helix-hairpin-helix domain-containing protein [uncultured Imperialibacter sp.]|uniref:ComEA family DNA-binding protein n=1 Tax=uncultured Imperialibacter sp. TaxID=1672639 RepID=UPI0030D82372|tara:strand:+ start:6781 stop:8889 length:2109 start_codon:yes stop_codon:yes gene_type:complete
MLSPIKNSLTGIALCLLCCLQLHAQQQPPEPPAEDIDLYAFVQELFAIQDEDVNYDDLYESLFQLYTSPIDINLATFEELSSFYILSPIQIESLLNYRKLNGPLLSVYELQAVPNFDLATIRNIRPFVTVSGTGSKQGKPLFQRVADEKNNYLLLRTERTLETAKGYSQADTAANGDLSSRYAGSPYKHYARFRVSHPNDFSFGFTAEKDAGEELLWNQSRHAYGADFYSFHGQVKNQGNFKAINIGDYQLQMGQGLVFGAGFAAGKGGETLLTVKRNSTGLLPYTSVLETGFFRGAAATYPLGKWELTAIASRLRQDGTVRTDTITDGPEAYISSILNTGFHRTESEINGKGQVVEHDVGGNLQYKSGTFQFGLNTLYTQFSTPIQKTPALYNQFEFSGRANHISSLYFSKLWQNTQFFGEAARSSSGGWGAIGGLMVSITNSLGASMVARNYQRDFHSFYARSFGEASRNVNEKGIYWGIKWRATSKLLFTAYYDKFSFPWLRYNTDAPSDGNEYLAMSTYSFSKLTKFYVQLRQQTKAENGEILADNLQVPVETKKGNIILNLDHDTGNLLSFKSRLQLSRYEKEEVVSTGFAIIQDLNLTLPKWRFSSRIALFDTDDYSNRQYVYEKDVLYAFSIPAYTGKGIRTYLLAQYKIGDKVTIWGRWAKFSYMNTKSTGSGLQEINGSLKNDFKVQIKVALW